MPMSDDELVAAYLDLQDLLRRAGGQTPTTIARTVEFEREVVRALDLDVWDYDMVELMIDELHSRAYPDATTRPDRLCIEPAGCPLEDY
jgi:hypothetical protein